MLKKPGTHKASKSIIVVGLAIVLLLVAAACTNLQSSNGLTPDQQTDDPFNSSETSSKDDGSNGIAMPSASIPPKSGMSSEEDIDPQEPLSYEEFFSREIKFAGQIAGFTDYGIIFIYEEFSKDAEVYDWETGQFYNALPDAIAGQLYRREATENGASQKFTLIMDESVTEYVERENDILCAVGNVLYRVDYLGENKEILVTMESPITNLQADETLAFFVVDEYIYRHYIPSGTTDLLCYAPNIIPGYPLPITNHKVRWISAEPNPDGMEYIRRYFSYDDREGIVQEN